MCGPRVYLDFQYVEKLEAEQLITDPVVTRLWLIILFFSTPLHYHNDDQVRTPLCKKGQTIFKAQNAYLTLLWKYLLHRYQESAAIRILSTLIRVYLKIQLVGHEIYVHLRSKQELIAANEALQKVSTLDLNEQDEDTIINTWKYICLSPSNRSFLSHWLLYYCQSHRHGVSYWVISHAFHRFAQNIRKMHDLFVPRTISLRFKIQSGPWFDLDVKGVGSLNGRIKLLKNEQLDKSFY